MPAEAAGASFNNMKSYQIAVIAGDLFTPQSPVMQKIQQNP